MELPDELRKSYAAASQRYARTLAKRPFWDRFLFLAALIAGRGGTESWLGHHSGLASGWRFLIAIIVASLTGIVVSVVLDKLHSATQS